MIRPLRLSLFVALLTSAYAFAAEATDAAADSSPPLVPLVPLAPQARAGANVHLITAAQNAELYDVTRAVTVCRAPCGLWLDSADLTHPYRVVGQGMSRSSDISLNALTGDVDIKFTPRNETRQSVGLALTIIGGVAIIGAFLCVFIWGVEVLLGNLLLMAFHGAFWSGTLQLLYAAAAGAGVAAPTLSAGIPLFITGRERMDVDARPQMMPEGG